VFSMSRLCISLYTCLLHSNMDSPTLATHDDTSCGESRHLESKKKKQVSEGI
jgi:hypothetical protein